MCHYCLAGTNGRAFMVVVPTDRMFFPGRSIRLSLSQILQKPVQNLFFLKALDYLLSLKYFILSACLVWLVVFFGGAGGIFTFQDFGKQSNSELWFWHHSGLSGIAKCDVMCNQTSARNSKWWQQSHNSGPGGFPNTGKLERGSRKWTGTRRQGMGWEWVCRGRGGYQWYPLPLLNLNLFS